VVYSVDRRRSKKRDLYALLECGLLSRSKKIEEEGLVCIT
jgi:hypothetical protein